MKSDKIYFNFLRGDEQNLSENFWLHFTVDFHDSFGLTIFWWLVDGHAQFRGAATPSALEVETWNKK